MGLDITLFPSGVDNDLVCDLCKNVLLEPVQTKCGHVFCRVCLRDALLQTNLKFCPMCKSTLDYFVKQPSEEFKLRLLCLTIRCSNDCGIECKLEDLPDHVSDSCPNTPVTCVNLSRGCKKCIRRCDLERHAKECVFREVECEACGYKTILREMYSHQRRTRCLETKLKQQLIREFRKTEDDTKQHIRDIQKVRLKIEIEQRKALDRTRSFHAHSDVLNLKVGVRRDPTITDKILWSGAAHSPLSIHKPVDTTCHHQSLLVTNEDVFLCRRCQKLFKAKTNSLTSCRWHAGPIIPVFGGTCYTCGHVNYHPGCMTHYHQT